MEIKELTFETYLKASALHDEDKINEFYKKLFGDDWSLLLTYHLKTKQPKDLSNVFNIEYNLDNMVFGQFIGNEKALSGGLSNEQSIEYLAYSLIRPKSDKEFDNTDAEKEQSNMNAILNSDARSVLDILNTFTKSRGEYINVKYKGVFYMTINENETEEDSEEENEFTPEDKFTNDWYWYAIVRTLADDGIVFQRRTGMSDIECVLMTKMSDIAPELAYKRQKQIIEEARQRRQESLNRLK